LRVVGLLFAAIVASCSQPRATDRRADPGLEVRLEGLRNPEAYVVGGAVEPRWLPDGNRFWFVKDGPSGAALVVVDPTETDISPVEIPWEGLKRRLEELGEDSGIGVESISALEPTSATFDSLRIWIEERAYLLEAADLGLSSIGEPVEPPVEPGISSGNRLETTERTLEAFVRDNNVWIRNVRTGAERPLTADGTEDFQWRAPAASPGSNLSPDSRYGVFLKAVSWPQGHEKAPAVYLHEILRLWKDPEARKEAEGQDLVDWINLLRPLFRPYLIDLSDGSVTRVPVPDPRRTCFDDAGKGSPCMETYHFIGWLPDASEFLLAQAFQDAHPDHAADVQGHDLRLLAFDPSRKTIRTVIEEGEDLHVLTRGGGPFLGGALWLLSDNTFLWLSERDGWRHIYRYDLSGQVLARGTSGTFPVDWILAVDEEEGWIYFTGADDLNRPYDRHLYRSRLDGSGFTRLTEAPGVHHPGVHVGYSEQGVGIAFSPSGSYFLDTHSAVDRSPTVELRRSDGTFLRVLDRADASRLESELAWMPPEEFVVKAADDTTDLYGVLYKPSNFDPARSYPVVEYIHNLPEAVLVEHGFSPAGKAISRVFELRGLAEMGFIVVKLDSRGTGERGRAFSDWEVREGMELITADHAGALRQLAAHRPWMDLSRVGIMGASRGSLQALRAMCQAPEIYRAGVTISTIVGTGYSWDMTAAGVIPMLDKLVGPHLMIQGTNDGGIIDVLRLSEEYQRLGKQQRIVLLPGAPHVPQGEDRRYMNTIIRDFFNKALEN